jgi:hypothetical protein
MGTHAIKLSKTEIEATPYTPAARAFEALMGSLQAPEGMTMTHAEAERHIKKETRELGRLLMQAHFDERAPAVVERGRVTGRDGVERTHRREHTRPLRGMFGLVRVRRMGYGARGATSLHPLDAALNLPSTDQYSHGVREQLAEQVAKQSFDSAIESVERLTGTHVPKRQAEELVQEAARDFEGFYAAREAKSAAEVRQTSELLVLTTDAKGIAVHHEDLRPDTQHAAALRAGLAARRFKLGLPKDPDPRLDRKRMAQVAAVYTLAPFVRTPEQIVGELRDELRAVVPRPRPEDKRLWASVVEDPLKVMDDMFAEALRRDPKVTKRWLGLVDGNPDQIAYFEKLAEAYGIEFTIIVDFIHVAGYVWKAGFALFGRGTNEAAKWVRERLGEILRGKSSLVAAGMRRSATNRDFDAAQRKPIDDCANYLHKYGKYLRYDEYLAVGYPIATGVIEGACRYLVQDRLGITGAVWGLQSAEAVLRLRAIAASGDIDDYWEFHEREEHRRNHANLYAGCSVPEIVIPGTAAGRPKLRSVP